MKIRDLRGEEVLLTGAGTGLGPHIARRLAGAGARLVLSGRNRTALESLAEDLPGARAVVADLSRREEVERLAQEAGAAGVLVSNAGLPASGRLDGFTLGEIDNAIRVNLQAGIMLSRLLLPAMLERRSGQLVFMASMAAHVPGPKTSLYNATKFGLRGFALALRMELHGSGVGVSLVSPTYVSQAGMWAETGLKANPMAGEVSPAEVASAVLRAIKENRREIQVAPAAAVAGARLGALFPGVMERVTRGSGAATHPDAAVERQRHKR
ncbi:MAG TPA: SDR family NAD(P)-dependent oxidoreductase [Candidatus Dormibacteraeota bacterium]|nr:SDR family NAD(P)-dependent oxidoreductase [Candidatus Dormibacteraeota bacterium]